MRIVRFFLILPLLLLLPLPASADAVVAGDLLKFGDLPGNTGGGEFKLTINSDPSNWFISFCLQKTEYMNFTSNFIVGSITGAAMTDPVANGGDAVTGADPISKQTAWLYTQFRTGSLSQYAYNNVATGTFATQEASANALQHAFWGLEGEEAIDPNNFYVQLANQQNLTNWDASGVKVLNLYVYSATAPDHRGSEAQDQLVLVPEPSTMALFGVGAFATVLKRRRSMCR
jgi:PEP-CTERM motif-containing protein